MFNHVIAENKGTLARNAQKKNTAISIYWQEKNKRNVPPRPGAPSKCKNLSHAKYYLNEDVLAVNRLMSSLIDEGLVMKMKQLHEDTQTLRKYLKEQKKKQNKNNKNKNEEDDDTNDEQQDDVPPPVQIDETEKQSQYNSVRLINNKLHNALIEKDIWERRVQELDLIAKEEGVSEQDAAEAVSRSYQLKNPKKRPKGFYGAARYLPEAQQQQQNQKQQKSQQKQQSTELPQRRQREDDEQNEDDNDTVSSDDDDDNDSHDSVDDLLSGILPSTSVNQSSRGGRRPEPRKLFGSSSSSTAIAFLSDFLSVNDNNNQKNDDVVPVQEKEQDNDEDLLLLPDPSTIPSEKEIQQQILAEKKAMLRARFLASKTTTPAATS